MGFSADEDMVRVDFFKPSGKWYCTEAVKWLTYRAPQHNEKLGTGKCVEGCFHEALASHFGDTPRLVGMTAVCIEPFHEHSQPQMVVVKDYTKQEQMPTPSVTYYDHNTGKSVPPPKCPSCGRYGTWTIQGPCMICGFDPNKPQKE